MKQEASDSNMPQIHIQEEIKYNISKEKLQDPAK